MAENPKLKKLERCKRQIDVNVPAQDVLKELEQVYDAIQKTAQVPGFRVGKVPREIIEKQYAKEAKEEMLRRIVPDSYRKSLEALGITPLTMPEISDVKMELGKVLSYSATFDIRPDVKLKNYKGLKVKKTLKEVNEEEINKVMDSLRERSARFEDVPARGAKMGDYVVCDIEVFDGEKNIDKRQKVWVYMDEKFTIPGFCQGLVGVKPEEKKSIETQLPADHPDKQYAGKTVRFDAVISVIKEKKLSALDDEFAKELGKYQSLAELKKAIEDDIKARHEREMKLEMENQLLDQLHKSVSFDLPDTIVQAQKKRLTEDFKHELSHKGLSKEDIDKKAAEMEKNISEKAEKDVRTYFILEKVAELEDIKISQQELEDRIKKVADYSRKAVDEVKKYLEDNDMFDDMIVEMREDKVMDFLVKNALIEESK